MGNSAFPLDTVDVGCGATERPVSDFLLAVSAVPARDDRYGSVYREIIIVNGEHSRSSIEKRVELDHWSLMSRVVE